MRKSVFLILLILTWLTSDIANAETIIKVTSNTVNPTSGLEEESYDQDCIGIAIEGEASSDADAQMANDMADHYIQSFQGLRYLSPWTASIFKVPKEARSSKTISSKASPSYQEYLKKDTFSSYEIEYRLKVFNKERVFIGNSLFYEGGLSARPEVITFMPQMAPKKIPGGKTSTTWGLLKSEGGR